VETPNIRREGPGKKENEKKMKCEFYTKMFPTAPEDRMFAPPSLVQGQEVSFNAMPFLSRGKS
jgi:hypothetical protein